MKLNPRNIALFLLLALSIVGAGCPPPPEAPAQEQKVDAAEADLDDAHYIITDETITASAAEGVPQETLDALTPIKGIEYDNTPAFDAAVRGQVPDISDEHLAILRRNALVVEQTADAAPEVEETAEVDTAYGSAGFEPVFFDLDRSEVKSEFIEAVQKNAERLKADTTLQVALEGHCDERGSNEYNLALGERRAQALRRALIAEGVPASQLRTVSYGEERPAVDEGDEEAWSKNRRAVVRLEQ